MLELALRLNATGPNESALASQLAARAVALGKGPAMVEQRSDGLWVVWAGEKWARSHRGNHFHLNSEFGMNSLAPQAWFHLLDGGAAYAEAGASEWTLIVDVVGDMPELPSPSADRDGVCFWGHIIAGHITTDQM